MHALARLFASRGSVRERSAGARASVGAVRSRRARATVGVTALAPAFLGALSSLACVGPVEEEATLVASLTIVGSVDENTCGAQAVPLQDPWKRPAQLSRGEGDLYLWREVATGVVVQGTRTAGGEYRFRGASEQQLFAADPSLGYPGCRVRLDDELRFTLDEVGAADAGSDAGSSASYSLEGRQTTVVSIVAGSDCSPALNANGGNFLALPCEFTYDLVGDSDAD